MAEQNSPHGHKHWLWTRLFSLPLIPLAFYFLCHIEHLTARTREDFISWLQQPAAALAMGLFILCSFFHACLGMEDIIEDYISSATLKKLALCVNKLFFLLLGAASLYALVSIYCGRS